MHAKPVNMVQKQ